MIQTLSSFLSHLSGHVFAPGFNQTSRARRVHVIGATVLALVLACKAWRYLFGWAHAQAGTVVEGERLLFAANVIARLHVTLPLLGLGLILAWAFFQILDRTRMGARLTHWDSKDTEHTEAAKTRNSGLILASLILGIFIVLAQVVR